MKWREFDWVKTNSSTLLVTIGESWTWGDSLVRTQHKYVDDREFRLANVFGGQLATKLGADFLNIAEPGQSNTWIANQYKEFVDAITEFDYKRIIIVLTLTEVGREFEGDLDQTRDYQASLHDTTNINMFLKIMSSYVENIILSVDRSRIELLIGTNFVDSNYDQELRILEQSWVDIIATQTGTLLARPCYVVNSWVFERFDKLLNFANQYPRDQFLTEIMTLMATASKRTDFLLASPVNYKQASKHPTPDGHTMWANYLYQQL